MSDKNAGLGGSYLLDVKTGTRTLVERTDADIDEANPAPEALAPDIASEPAPVKPPAK